MAISVHHEHPIHGRDDMTFTVSLQLGHQAINCTNGTINWKQIYGEESFKLKAPIYPSDYDAVKKAKTVDVDKVTKLAQEWRTVNLLCHLASPSRCHCCLREGCDCLKHFDK